MRGFRFALAALLCVPSTLPAQWTVQPGGWFMSHGFNSGRFPDRFSGQTRNALEKLDWGMYFIYGLRNGLSVGFGQPPALDQVEIELPIPPQQVLLALGQGRHTIELHKKTMSPNVA